MSNPCYAINAAMGRILVDSLERIETTSDVYVHRLIGTRVDHYTAIPPAAYELSWSTGELRSEIRPKQERVDYLRRRLQSLATDSVEYGEVKEAIEIEQQGISSFDEFNSNPETKPFTR
jgi:hypothetical protein